MMGAKKKAMKRMRGGGMTTVKKKKLRGGGMVGAKKKVMMRKGGKVRAKQMATSNSRDFDLDVAEIIEEAYERCGMEVRTGYDAKTARRSLNLMFADWANRGLNLWTVTQATQALTSGTASYTFSSNFTDLLDVVIRDSSSTDFSISRISRSEYLNIPNKTQQN